MPIPGQRDMFGTLSWNVDVLPTCRRLMHAVPKTYKSHRLLMLEFGKEIGATWIEKLDSDELTQLETLLDLSPDIERSSRKVREEDEERERRARMGLPTGAAHN